MVGVIYFVMDLHFLFKRTLGVVAGIAIVCSLSACSSDDDDAPETVDLDQAPEVGEIPSLPTPVYEASAAKYELSSGSISSIELTAAGDYIIINNGYRATDVFPPVICGKYTKNSDTEYILENYGTIVIEGSTENAVSLQITPTGGVTTTVAAHKASTIQNSAITDAVCRTWNLDNCGMRLSFNNALVFNGMKPVSEYDNLREEANSAWESYLKSHYGFEEDEFDEYEPIGYYPVKIIITKAGTYMVEYSNETVAVSTWYWLDEMKGKFQYSWDYDTPNSQKYGNADNYFSFSGDKLIVWEYHRMTQDGVNMGVDYSYQLSVPR